MLVFPIIPSPRLSLLSVINFLLITVTVLIIGLLLLLLPLCSLHQVLVLQFSDFFKGHRWFISILLPDLSDYLFSLLRRTHTTMNLLFRRHIPYLYLWDWFSQFFFMFFPCFRILSNRILIVKNLNFLLKHS